MEGGVRVPTANVLGLVLKNNHILLEKFNGAHSLGEGVYYRPIGGKIEHGESSQATLIREFKEEVDIEIIIDTYISCVENIFNIGNEIGHEITQVYVVKFKDENLYDKPWFEVIEGERVSIAEWIPLKELEKVYMYPIKLKEIIFHNPFLAEG
nr:NUDIX domain-containing protein [Thalassobacillus sp. CUG 92003]